MTLQHSNDNRRINELTSINRTDHGYCMIHPRFNISEEPVTSQKIEFVLRTEVGKFDLLRAQVKNLIDDYYVIKYRYRQSKDIGIYLSIMLNDEFPSHAPELGIPNFEGYHQNPVFRKQYCELISNEDVSTPKAFFEKCGFEYGSKGCYNIRLWTHRIYGDKSKNIEGLWTQINVSLDTNSYIITSQIPTEFDVNSIGGLNIESISSLLGKTYTNGIIEGRPLRKHERTSLN